MPLFLVAVAAALPGRALEFAALGEERASRVGESTGVDGIPGTAYSGDRSDAYENVVKNRDLIARSDEVY